MVWGDLNHLRTISGPSHNHLSHLNTRQLDLWCGVRLPANLRSVHRYHVIHYTSKLISKMKILSKPPQVHLKTISKPSQNHLKPSQTISNHLKPSQLYPRWYLRPLTSHKSAQRYQTMCFAPPIELKNMKIHKNHLITIS